MSTLAAVGTLAGGCAGTHTGTEGARIAEGRSRFHDRDLGAPRSTGIPYALWLAAMERYPEDLGRDWGQVSERFGLLPNPERANGLPTGFVLERNGLTATDFLMTNCSLCHAGAVAGNRIEGLGSKTLRLNALDNAIMRVALSPSFTADSLIPAASRIARRDRLSWGWRSRFVTKVAIKRLRALARDHVALDGGPGRNTPVEFAKATCHVPIRPPYGYVKFPAVWTYGKRRSFGFDASMTGDRALALSAVEFNKRMSPDYILSRRRQWESIQAYIVQIAPPTYPGNIDSTEAARGHTVFLRTCSECHGTYSPGEPRHYEELVVPLEVVGTDPDRARAVTPELAKARNRTALGRHVRLEPREGYVSPPLEGIWCRGPYLHNGSVPTLADLLRPVAERPIRFWIGGDTDYDLLRVGLAYDEEKLPDGRRAGTRRSPSQFVFDVSAVGNGKEGHEFAASLSAADRDALLEYLKTL